VIEVTLRSALLAGSLAAGICITGTAAPLAAQRTRVVQIDTIGKTLSAALLEVAEKTGVGVIIAASDIHGKMAPPVKGTFSVDQILSRLLEGSGLKLRRSPDGSFIVSAPTETAAPAPQPVPEILVIGKRTQNADIQRAESDVQAYKVWTSKDVEEAHSTDIDDFLRSRVTSNTQIGSALQLHPIGDTRSEVNLRGLGSTDTLVLVDGRRMPSVPALALANVGIEQSDINAIPLSAISRIEVLNSTAGGIYGPGATGGVINVILKRDYRGVELNATQGLTARGDAPYTRIEGRIGFTPDGGATDVMLAASIGRTPQLLVGQRDFRAIARARHQVIDPAGYASNPPVSGSVNISSLSGAPLTFDAAYGGASLGAAVTSVPVGYGGVATDGGALFRTNAGRLDLGLAPGASGAGATLLGAADTVSGMANVRRHFGTTLELYIDALFLQGLGRSVVSGNPGPVEIAGNAPTNPFQQAILVSYPFSNLQTVAEQRTRTMRFTGGAIVDLPRGWKANADVALGSAAVRQAGQFSDISQFYTAYAYYGAAATAGFPVTLLGGQDAFFASLKPLAIQESLAISRTTRFSDLSLRLAGPLLQLPAGPLTLSLLAENRVERSAETIARLPGFGTADSALLTQAPLPAFSIRTRSVYAEVRVPVTDLISAPAGLRGIELQLAVRRDDIRSILPAATFDEFPDSAVTQRVDRAATLFTAGMKTSPIDGVLLRASIATGFLPPSIDQYFSYLELITHDPKFLPLAPSPGASLFLKALPDPQRPGQILGGEGLLTLSYGGSARLAPEHAQSFSIGTVVTPRLIDRLRVSLDYTHIRKTHEIVVVHPFDYAYYFQHEQQLPGRIIRAPLTEQDRAKGYTGGIVTAVDTTNFATGSTTVDALDLQLEYGVPIGRFGNLQFQGAATWQPKLHRDLGPEDGTLDYVGYSNGPLAWRANGGVKWSLGAQTLGLVLTYYDSYKVATAGASAATAATLATLQDGPNIPSQVYLDLFAARTFKVGASRRAMDLRVGVQNLLNHTPPLLVADGGTNYSTYGDPRLRRFEINVVSRF
jgi:iron complex outermembrane receptor protein